MGFGDSSGGWESEACTGGSGGEVWVEDAFLVVLGDSWTGVDDMDRVSAIGIAVDPEDEFIAGVVGVFHRVDGIDHEIEEGLFDVVGVDVDHYRGERWVEADLDAAGLGLDMEEVGKLFYEGVEICCESFETHLAGVFEEVFEDASEAVGFASEGADASAHAAFLVLVDGEVLDGFAEELGVESDGGEWVFDFVREP